MLNLRHDMRCFPLHSSGTPVYACSLHRCVCARILVWSGFGWSVGMLLVLGLCLCLVLRFGVAFIYLPIYLSLPTLHTYISYIL